MSLASYFVSSCFAIWAFWSKIVVFIFYPLIRIYILKRAKAVGAEFNGPRSFDIQLKNEKEHFTRCAVHWSQGGGEGYIDGLWTSRDLPLTIKEMIRNGVFFELLHPLCFLYGWFNLNKPGNDSVAVAEKHYDFGNDWYGAFLGHTMQYTCAYWKTATNLDQAQIDKMELIAHKLKLKPGMRIIDFGCGFGTLSMHLARNYGVSAVCITNSTEQAKYIRENAKGLPIEVRMCDYREVKDAGTFDRALSIGFSEHVGRFNYRGLLKIFSRCLKPDGLAFIQIIMRVNSKRLKIGNEPFLNKYIFPNSWALTFTEFTKAAEGVLSIEDWACHGQYYTRTLEAWRENFQKSWPHFKNGYDEKVYRMWDLYFSIAIALFSERLFTLCQIVLLNSDCGEIEGYLRP